MCDSKEALVSFLYGELDGPERQAFEAHLARCAECRDDVRGLRATQDHLAHWSPPEPDLGFRIVRAPAAPARPLRPVLPWGLAAAAVIVLAAGAALANLEIRYGADGLAVRTGWAHAAAGSYPTGVAGSAEVGSAAAGVAAVNWQEQAQALERRVRQLEAALGGRGGSLPARADAADPALLRRVNEIVAQSEARQQRAVAAHLERLTEDINARRKMDLALIDQGLMRLQTTSGAELRQSRDLMQRMYRATAYQPK